MKLSVLTSASRLSHVFSTHSWMLSGQAALHGLWLLTVAGPLEAAHQLICQRGLTQDGGAPAIVICDVLD